MALGHSRSKSVTSDKKMNEASWKQPLNLGVILVILAMIFASFLIYAKAALGSGKIEKIVFANVQALFGTGKIPKY